MRCTRIETPARNPILSQKTVRLDWRGPHRLSSRIARRSLRSLEALPTRASSAGKFARNVTKFGKTTPSRGTSPRRWPRCLGRLHRSCSRGTTVLPGRWAPCFVVKRRVPGAPLVFLHQDVGPFLAHEASRSTTLSMRSRSVFRSRITLVWIAAVATPLRRKVELYSTDEFFPPIIVIFRPCWLGTECLA